MEIVRISDDEFTLCITNSSGDQCFISDINCDDLLNIKDTIEELLIK